MNTWRVWYVGRDGWGRTSDFETKAEAKNFATGKNGIVLIGRTWEIPAT